MRETRPVTIHDVARHAGVAVSSVSRALSDHPDVSASMRAKVRAAADELGYAPDLIARSMRSGTTGVVGLVVRDYATPFFGEVIRGIDEVMSDAGYTLIVTSSGRDAAHESKVIGTLRQRRVEALMLATVSDRDPATRKALAAYDRPLVLLDRQFPRLSVPRILFDHASGVRDATADLLAKGHRRIAFVTGTPDVRPTRERLRGFVAAYRDAGLDEAEAVQASEVFSAAVARDTSARLLGQPARLRPTAVITGGMQATSGVLEAMSDLGLRPGDDVSLVCCDDLPWLRVMRPRVSAVSRDASGFGRAAAEQVLRLVRGEKPTDVVLPTVYEPRETTRPAPRRASPRS